MVTHDFTMHQALSMVRQSRPQSQPNIGFCAQLLALERKRQQRLRSGALGPLGKQGVVVSDDGSMVPGGGGGMGGIANMRVGGGMPPTFGGAALGNAHVGCGLGLGDTGSMPMPMGMSQFHSQVKGGVDAGTFVDAFAPLHAAADGVVGGMSCGAPEFDALGQTPQMPQMGMA